MLYPKSMCGSCREKFENGETLRRNNPWALEEISRRLIEAYERKLWNTDEEIIAAIRNNYLELEGVMEDSMGEEVGDFQGGSVDIVNLDELESYKKNVEKMRAALQ